MNLGGLSFHGTNSDFKSISQYKSAMSALTEKVETNPQPRLEVKNQPSASSPETKTMVAVEESKIAEDPQIPISPRVNKNKSDFYKMLENITPKDDYDKFLKSDEKNNKYTKE